MKKSIAQKCSCHSVWCERCFVQYHAPAHMNELKEFNWKKTRQIILTVNPLLFKDGQEAYEKVSTHRMIAGLVRNLGRGKKERDSTGQWVWKYKPINIIRWKWFLEWYKNGYPHWHLFIEVEKSGRAGMIGQDVIHYYWPIAQIIKEKYVTNLSHWRALTGYFKKTGYFTKGKSHQVKLPEWALNIKNLKIRRSGSSIKKQTSRRKSPRINMYVIDQSTGEITDFNQVPKRKKPRERTYKARFKSCGLYTRIKVSGPDFTVIAVVDIPYKDIRKLPGHFEKTRGYCFNLTDEQVNRLFDKILICEHYSYSVRQEWLEDRLDAWEKQTIRQGGYYAWSNKYR